MSHEPDYPSERLRRAQRLLDRLLEDPALRADFARDPEATAIGFGIDLDDTSAPAGQSGATDESRPAGRAGG